VPFFFKQWGGVRQKEAGRVLDGRRWEEYPRGVEVGMRV
jgi:protein gp37